MFRQEINTPIRQTQRPHAIRDSATRNAYRTNRLGQLTPILLRAATILLACAQLAACVARQGKEIVVKPAQDEKLKIGAFMSLTGDTAQYGISALNGIRMAVEEANARGGVAGHRIELLVQDTRSNDVETDVVVRRLTEELRVHALIGEIVSSRSLRAASIAQTARVPMLTPSATSPEVTKQGDYIFRSCYTDPFQGAALAQFAARTLQARRAALLVDGGERYSIELARVIREEFARQGGEIVVERNFSKGAGSFSVPLGEVSAARPDIIFIPAYYLEAGQLARQAKEMGLPAHIIGGDGWDSPRLYEIGGQSLAGSYFSTHFSAEDPDPQVQRFVEDYRRLYGGTPDAFAATAYDAARIMLAACEGARTLDRTAIRDALAATKDFYGVTGTVTFNSERNAVKPIVIVRIGDAGRQSVEAHIKPSDITPRATPTPSPTPQKKRRRRAA